MGEPRFQIIRPDDWHAQPWKNGGGTTYEIAREDDAQGFTWRLSLAHVDQDGPFSRFPGVDRTICLVEGPGFTLRRDGTPLVTLTQPLEPFEFAGEGELDCVLVGGPVRDLNHMIRREVWRSTTTRHTLASGESVSLPPADRTLVFVARGSVGLIPAAGAPALHDLATHTTAVFANHPEARLDARRARTQLVIATLARRQR